MSNESKLDMILENQNYQKDKLKQIDKILRGNGDPSKGLVVRFDRVEQAHLADQAGKKRNAAMAATALLGFLGSLALLVIRLTVGV